MLAISEDKMAGTISCRCSSHGVVEREKHRAFIVEKSLKMASVVETHRIYRQHFNIAHRGNVPCFNTTQLWVEKFRTNASALKKKPLRRVCTLRSLQNI
jgi:hypothetical protein